MMHEVKDPVEVESNKGDGDDTMEVTDKCLEKPTSIELRSAIETIMGFSFFMESKKVQLCTVKISALVENELFKKIETRLN